MISPVIFFSVVIGVIDGFQYFTEAYVIANGGQPTDLQLGEPQGSLLFYALWMYQKALPGVAMGYASAMAWMLFLVTMIATLDPVQDLEPVGLLPGGRPVTTTTPTATRSSRRSTARSASLPAHVRRKKLLATMVEPHPADHAGRASSWCRCWFWC